MRFAYLIFCGTILWWSVPYALGQQPPARTLAEDSDSAVRVPRSPASLAQARLDDLLAERSRILAERDRMGGWEEWKKSLTPFRADLSALLDAAHNPSAVREVGGGYLFNTAEVSYLLADSFLRSTAPSGPEAPNTPLSSVVDLHEQLKRRGIDLIFVPIPPRSEMIPSVLSPHAPEQGISAAPQRAEFMLALLDAGVEVIDLYPGFAKVQRDTGNSLCFTLDAHWNNLGIAEGGRQVAERLKRYDFIPRTDPRRKRYHTKTIEAPLPATIVGYLPQSEQTRYPPEMWTLEQVVDEAGVPYEDDDESPVLIVGDSYSFLLAEYHAGISARIAKEIGMPVARLSNRRGGPGVPRTLARQGKEYIDKRRVIVWMMVARYLPSSQNDDWQAAGLP